MVTFGGYSEDQICESVLSQRADPIYALYEFLSHRWKAGKRAVLLRLPVNFVIMRQAEEKMLLAQLLA